MLVVCRKRADNQMIIYLLQKKLPKFLNFFFNLPILLV